MHPPSLLSSGLAFFPHAVSVTPHPVSRPRRCLHCNPRTLRTYRSPQPYETQGSLPEQASGESYPTPRTEKGQAVTPRVVAGRSSHSAVFQPLPRWGSSNPGGCAPRAATSLAQPGASYVSQSSPFIPQQLGFLLGKAEVVTSASPVVTHFVRGVQDMAKPYSPRGILLHKPVIPAPSSLLATPSYQL